MKQFFRKAKPFVIIACMLLIFSVAIEQYAKENAGCIRDSWGKMP